MVKSKLPKSKNSQAKMPQINMRLSPGDWEAFRAKAEALGMGTTTWIRMVCRQAAGLVQ